MELLGGVLGGSWGNLGASWTLLEVFGEAWRGLGGILGGIWSILEGFWKFLDAFCGNLSASWELVGGFLEGLEGFQRTFWKHFWMMFAFLEQYVKIARNLGNPSVFHY